MLKWWFGIRATFTESRAFPKSVCRLWTFWNLAHIEKKRGGEPTHSDAEKEVASSEYRLISIPCIQFLTESE